MENSSNTAWAINTAAIQVSTPKLREAYIARLHAALLVSFGDL